MKQVFLGLLLILAATFTTQAQGVNMNFSPTKKVKARKEGMVEEFIGSTTKNVYTKNRAIAPFNKRKFQFIVSHDKKTLAETGRLPIYGNGTPREKKLDDALLIGTCFSDDMIMLVHRIKKGKGDDFEVMAEVFDEKMKNIVKLTKIADIKDFIGKKKTRELMNMVVRQSIDKKECALFIEFGNGENKELTFGIVQFDFELKNFPSSTTELPVIQTTKKVSNRMAGSYYFPGDGYVYAKHVIREDNDKTKKLWKNGKLKVVLNRFDPETESFDQFDIVDDKYSLSDMQIISNGTTTKIVGLYRDPKLLTRGDVSHGVFAAGFNGRNKEMEELTFTPFDSESFDLMFHRKEMSKRKQKKADKQAKKKGKEVADDKMESVPGDLIVDDLKMDAEGNVLMFISLMYNYTVQVCSTSSNGVQNCRDVPYCRRTDINAILITTKNELKFTEHLDRMITYPGWFIYDVSAAQFGEYYYIYYGDADTSEERKEKRKKLRVESSLVFKYAVLNTSSEKIEEKKVDIAQVSDKKKFRRSVSPTTIAVLDGEVYSYSLTPRLGYQAIPTCLFIFPMYVASFHPEMMYNFYGTLVNITPTKESGDSKPKKKKK